MPFLSSLESASVGFGNFKTHRRFFFEKPKKSLLGYDEKLNQISACWILTKARLAKIF
jgi:hypothetical protein